MSDNQSKEATFEKKTNADGSVNKKYVDVLDEDKPVSGQKFVCVYVKSAKRLGSTATAQVWSHTTNSYRVD